MVFLRLFYQLWRGISLYGTYTVEFLKRVAGHVKKGGMTGAARERFEMV